MPVRPEHVQELQRQVRTLNESNALLWRALDRHRDETTQAIESVKMATRADTIAILAEYEAHRERARAERA